MENWRCVPRLTHAAATNVIRTVGARSCRVNRQHCFQTFESALRNAQLRFQRHHAVRKRVKSCCALGTFVRMQTCSLQRPTANALRITAGPRQTGLRPVRDVLWWGCRIGVQKAGRSKTDPHWRDPTLPSRGGRAPHTTGKPLPRHRRAAHTPNASRSPSTRPSAADRAPAAP